MEMCKSGRHPRTTANTYVKPSNGKRSCRPCRRERRKDNYVPRQRRSPAPEPDGNGRRTCRECRRRKPLGAFAVQSNGKGRNYQCKSCKTFRDNLWLKYRITVEQYNGMLEGQHGVCAICKQPQRILAPHTTSGDVKRLCVDHCAETLAIRGLLCDDCNRAIGLLHDQPDLARAAAAYLEGSL